MIRPEHRYLYMGRNLAYHNTVVTVLKVEGRFCEVRLGNGLLFPNVPTIHLKELHEKEKRAAEITTSRIS